MTTPKPVDIESFLEYLSANARKGELSACEVFAQLVDRAHRLSGMLLKEYAARIKVNRNQLSLYLKGQYEASNIRATTLNQISDDLGCSSNDMEKAGLGCYKSPKENALSMSKMLRANELLEEINILLGRDSYMHPVTSIIKSAVQELGFSWDEDGIRKALSSLVQAKQDQVIGAIKVGQYTRDEIASIAAALSIALQRDVSVETMLLANQKSGGGPMFDSASTDPGWGLSQRSAPIRLTR